MVITCHSEGSFPHQMNPSRSALTQEIKHLLEQVQAAQDSLANACTRTNSLIDQLQTIENKDIITENEYNGNGDGTFDNGEPQEKDVDLEELDHCQSPPASSLDHYVELPFMDPYDCFDETAPLESFPAPQRLTGAGALEGLFQSDPERLGAKAPGPDIEIEYLPDGGYRMRSLPGKRAPNRSSNCDGNGTMDSLTEADDQDPFDGLSS